MFVRAAQVARSRWLLVLGMAWWMLLAGCTSADTGGAGLDRSEPDTPELESPDGVPDPGDTASDDTGEQCQPEMIGEAEGPVVVIYVVESGQLGEVCFGSPDSVAEEGWDALAEVAPPEQLDAIGLFAAYVGETDTLAFAGPVAEDNQEFLVAVDLESASADPDELRLTMLHEFAHVFTQTPDQLDLELEPDECDTYWNGTGCFRPNSYLAQWVALFWSAEMLASLPEDGGTDEPGGEDRCSIDPRFLGGYAASHPEEDFAETFSAFVFAIEAPPELADKFAFFHDRPELVGFADRAAAADRESLPNNFEPCG